MIENFEDKFQVALQEVAANGDKYSKHRLNHLKRAGEDPYHFMVFVAPLWSAANDAAFCETRLNALLMEAHGIPACKDEIRENKNDFWPEMRWLVDATVQTWARRPKKGFITLNQSELKQTLDNVREHAYAPINILQNQEIEWLHQMRLGARTTAVEIISQNLQEFYDSRRTKLETQLRSSEDRTIANHRPYLLQYFGFNVPVV